MGSFSIDLSSSELARFNERFPRSGKSADIGKRGVELIKFFYRQTHPGCTFVTPPLGADLAVVIGDAEPVAFEIKGTADADIAWPQLKCSSRTSYELLKSGTASVLRVTNVFGEKPVVFELKHGRDFRLEPEARWMFKPIREA